MSRATSEVTVDVYEIIADATFLQMFRTLSSDLNKLCLTQDQIEEFCLKHTDFLRDDGFPTYFIFKENRKYFVAYVSRSFVALNVHVHRLEDTEVWVGENRARLVVPKF